MEQCVRVRVGRRLKQARNEQGLTMAGLAEVLGVTEKSVTNYESGRREPDWATLERIAQATKRDIAWFFQDDDAAPPGPAAMSGEEGPAPTPPAQPESRGAPDAQTLLAQLVAAQTAMTQAQARADARLERLEGLMTEVVELLREEAEGGCRCHGEDSDLRSA